MKEEYKTLIEAYCRKYPVRLPFKQALRAWRRRHFPKKREVLEREYDNARFLAIGTKRYYELERLTPEQARANGLI